MTTCEYLQHQPPLATTRDDGLLRIVTLDVENRSPEHPDGFVGESILIITPTGNTMLVDAAWPSDFSLPLGGPVSRASPSGGKSYGANIILPYLKRRYISTIDWMLATHPHPDHIGGMSELILSDDLSVERLLWSPVPDEKYLEFEGVNAPFYVEMVHNLVETCARKGVPMLVLRQGEDFDLGGGVLCEVLAAAEPDEDVDSYVNNNSVVLRLTYGSFSMILTGDAGFVQEGRILARRKCLATDVLNIGHHAGANSTCDEWVRALSSTVAVASMPRWLSEDERGLRVYNQLSAAGMDIYRTWQDGHIEVQSDGARFWVVTEKTRT